MDDTTWYQDIWDWTSDAATSTFNYINDNEWAANLLGGAAAGAAQYKMQEDQQAHERDLLREKQRFEVDVNKITPATGSVVGGAYTQGLTNGILAQKKV